MNTHRATTDGGTACGVTAGNLSPIDLVTDQRAAVTCRLCRRSYRDDMTALADTTGWTTTHTRSGGTVYTRGTVQITAWWDGDHTIGWAFLNEDDGATHHERGRYEDAMAWLRELPTTTR